MSPRGPYMVGGHRVSETTVPNRDSTLADLIGPRVIYAPNAPRSLNKIGCSRFNSKGQIRKPTRKTAIGHVLSCNAVCRLSMTQSIRSMAARRAPSNAAISALAAASCSFVAASSAASASRSRFRSKALASSRSMAVSNALGGARRGRLLAAAAGVTRAGGGRLRGGRLLMLRSAIGGGCLCLGPDGTISLALWWPNRH